MMARILSHWPTLARRVAMYVVRGTLAFLPAVLFLRFAQWNGPASDERWLLAFRVSLPFACAYLLYAAWRPTPANRLVLATNAYLLGGGAMAWGGWYAGLAVYGRLRESMVLLAVVAVGALTTWTSQAGFVGVAGAPTGAVRRASLRLLAGALAALAFSWCFRGQPFLAAVVPLMALSAYGQGLSARLRTRVTPEGGST